MTPRTTRLFRRGLLALVLAVGVSVAWTFRRPPKSPAPAPTPTPGPASSALPGTRQENLVYRQFKGERESFVLKARTFVGQEQQELRFQGVEVTLSYTARGKPGTAVISSDDCVYEPNIQKAVFRGHVVVRTEDGFELKTESLVYRGDKGQAKTEAPVEFKRKDLSGTSTGAVYQAEEGRLELPADVVLRIQDEKQPTTEVRSRSATAEREQGLVKFVDSVDVTQGNDRLKAGKLTVNIGADDTIYRAQATDDVDLQTAGDLPGATISSGGRGPRRLLGRKLDLYFRPDRTLSEATAGPDADLTILPGPGEPAERRRLRGRFLVFRFDEQGKLQEVQGQKDGFFSVEAIPPAKAVPRTLRCQNFVARLDVATGQIQSIEFSKDLEFVEGGRKATSQKGTYDGPLQSLDLTEGPQIVDADRGWRLAAQTIHIGMPAGDLAARIDVKNTMRSERPGAQGGFMNGPDTVATCRVFDYTAKTRTARYREDALLRSGKDEVRAAEIRMQETEGGKRRLEAEGGVTSLLHPRSTTPKTPASPGTAPPKTPAPVEGRAATMSYDEAATRVIYRGEVVIRQGDIETRSPEATLTLTPDGGGLKSLVAGEPVAVKQGTRTATGTRGTYTPADETMVLVGENVVLKDPTQEVQGRSLTFQVGNETILVNGQEEIRTQAIFRKEPPKP